MDCACRGSWFLGSVHNSRRPGENWPTDAVDCRRNSGCPRGTFRRGSPQRRVRHPGNFRGTQIARIPLAVLERGDGCHPRTPHSRSWARQFSGSITCISKCPNRAKKSPIRITSSWILWSSGDLLALAGFAGCVSSAIAPFLRCRILAELPKTRQKRMSVERGQRLLRESPAVLCGDSASDIQRRLRSLDDFLVWRREPPLPCCATVRLGSAFSAAAREERRWALRASSRCRRN